MGATSAAKTSGRRQAKDRQQEVLFDRELEDLPAELRWREWMLRVEAVIFASAEPVSRETLARVIGKDCSIDLLIDDLSEELSSRPYELVSVAGGWQHRTRSRYADAIRSSSAPTRSGAAALSEFEAMVLMAVGYYQPVTRGELSKIFGKEVSRDTIAALRSAGFLASGPRSPTPGAPYTYVTTRHFLSAFGMETLRDLPNIEALEDAGLLSRQVLQQAAATDLENEASEDE
ncbi:SMC-Scp complex subunit ScpB [Rhizobium beringeri]|uniref:Segregation and condensation protein B n=1 Tax=Rhizobium leguminosarum TaxID=384 RepID=A0A1B1CPC3_RHILE|nr:SMC-Scp complex subunit ScpB [Rhizobium leguminosarum]ANP89257.1 segregation and condensation protein B [Rhizobium leguminosarum]ANP90569.1 segregation and condensation protein B [Rhizobium leguminosarum]ANP90980.1 segregation and condensation protein B [Rhizobium leguminosarum]ANP91566.1 segregation and condensation protein B [Rhizobium leguminosarum]API56053.1 segregation and condensation protein B [Rhizobium leguminosarum]